MSLVRQSLNDEVLPRHLTFLESLMGRLCFGTKVAVTVRAGTSRRHQQRNTGLVPIAARLNIEIHGIAKFRRVLQLAQLVDELWGDQADRGYSSLSLS